MDLVLDGLFRNLYRNSGFNKDNAFVMSHRIVKLYSTSAQNNIFNVLKVSEALVSPFSDFATRLFQAVYEGRKEKNYPTDDEFCRKDAVAFTLIFIHARKHPEASKYIKMRRDLEREVASEFFRTSYEDVSDDQIREISKVSMSYNVEEDPNISWDEHYFNIALQVSRNSKCRSRKIGAILVRDKRVISTGYNGAPEGIAPCDHRWFIDDVFVEKYGQKEMEEVEGKCPRYVLGFKSGQGLDICPAVHAEANSVINCARMGISAKDSTMYMTCGIPCMNCMKELINAGVSEIVVTSMTWYDDTSRYLLENSDVKVRLYDFIGEKTPNVFS